MEGFGYNPVVYDLVTDMIWRRDVPKLDEWLVDFTHRRYGKRVETAEQAWELLRRTVYQLAGVLRIRGVLLALHSRRTSPLPYDTHNWPTRVICSCPAPMRSARRRHVSV